jgi:Holliday junction resolvase RusA-like endonuclease
VSAVFTLRRPSSAPKRRRVWPVNARSGDLDKLVRGVLDPLHGFVFTDDAQVVSIAAAKVYPGEGDDALPSPGVVIRISAVCESS